MEQKKMLGKGLGQMKQENCGDPMPFNRQSEVPSTY